MERSLPADEVEVWVWRCPSDRVRAAHLAVLADAERARAARFVFERDRARFAAAHAGLRLVLAARLGIAAAAVVLTTDSRGKPRLAGPGTPPLRFNLSHSDEMAAVALSAHFEVGLDIERLRHIAAADVAVFFSAAEQAAVARLPAATRHVGILNAWTRKEAYLKAIGLGLAVPLDSFDVALAPDAPARLLRVADAPGEAECWQFAPIVPADGYIGAVAARARGWRVTLHDLALPD